MEHKILSLVILVVAVIAVRSGVQKWRGGTTPTSYVLGVVEKGSLITAVAGSGQVSVSDQVEIKAKASGTVTRVLVKEGQMVTEGAMLAQLDAKDGYKAVRDAEANLKSAQLSLQKLKQPATAYQIVQAENQLAAAKEALQKLTVSQPGDYAKAVQAADKATETLATDYEDSYNTIATAFTDLPNILAGLYSAVYSSDISKSESSIGSGQSNDSALLNSIPYTDSENRDKITQFVNNSKDSYQRAKAAYDANLTAYKDTARSSDPMVIERLLQQTIDTTRLVADTVKNETALFNFWVEYRTSHQQTTFAKITSYQADLNGYTTKTSSHLSSLLSDQRTLKDDKQGQIDTATEVKKHDLNDPLDLAAAARTVAEREASLVNLKAGADVLDIRSSELSVQQRQNALLDARQQLADYTVRAPFAGVVAKLNVKMGDEASSATAVATLIADQQTAVLPLNEVDVAKVSVGQKATLTFDAIDDLSLTGKVVQIDTLGTVSQGVVSYEVKIVFDAQDSRVKQGMTVNASIITAIKQNVLIVPSGAIKTQGTSQYVEVLNSADMKADASGVAMTSPVPPTQQPVETGLSNDSETEITSGLKEGDKIVVRTITQSTTQTSTQAPSLFGGGNRTPGVRTGGGFGGAR